MSTTTAYTPLECLLLFQSLVAFGTDEQDFDSISTLLTHNTLVKDGPTYDAQRLTSGALRSQYSRLLKEEVSSGSEAQDVQSTNATTKKRKQPSPPAPTLDDARDHKEKLPLMVERLYARYREYMIRAIREDEKRFAILKREIDEIERGEWDERVSKEGRPAPNDEGNLAAPEPQVKPNGVHPKSLRIVENAAIASPKPLTPTSRVLALPTASQPDTRMGGPTANNILNAPHVASPTPTRPPEPNRIHAQNHQAIHSNTPHPFPHAGPQPPGHLKWEPPYAAPNHMPQYQPVSHYPQHNTPHYAAQPYPPPQRGPFSSPNGLPPPHATVPSSPGHYQQPPPMLLPPSNAGVQRSPSLQGLPLDALADAAGQQYRANSGSPLIAQPGFPPPQGYFQQYPQHRPASASGPPQWSPQHLAQFQQTPQQYHAPPNQRPQFQPPPPLVPSENRQYNSPYNPNLAQRPAVPQTQAQRLQASLPSTPISRGPQHVFTGSGTRWTPTPTGVTPGNHNQLPQPKMEPLSPILRPLEPDVGQAASKNMKAKGPPRGVKRGRGTSTPSSVIIGSRRSQSVMSHADELSMDNEPIGRPVKEEVATPIGISDAGDTTADDSTLLRPESRGGLSARHSNKRKRGHVDVFPREPATHVMWTRNFPNIAKSALENISADKNASIFAKPVKEYDAPGYKNLILRPQDLKSIRAAISAGHRAASAAAPDDLNPNATNVSLPISEDLIPPKGIINNAQLEKELMRMFANAVMFNPDPDRGFGKHWQALGTAKGDALGYAIDEDSVVKSTREMFADVERIVGDLRAAERRSEETRENSLVRPAEDDEVDELAGDADGHVGHVGSVTKRRRKA